MSLFPKKVEYPFNKTPLNILTTGGVMPKYFYSDYCFSGVHVQIIVE